MSDEQNNTKKMVFVPIESKTATEVAYDGADKLQVRYANGGLYEYSTVTPGIYDGLMKAESKGKYLNKVVKKLPTRDLNEKPADESKTSEEKNTAGENKSAPAETPRAGVFNSVSEESANDSVDEQANDAWVQVEIPDLKVPNGAFNSDADKTESSSAKEAQETLDKIGFEAFESETQSEISGRSEDQSNVSEVKIFEPRPERYGSYEQLEDTDDGFKIFPTKANKEGKTVSLESLEEIATGWVKRAEEMGFPENPIKFRLGFCEREPGLKEAYRLTIFPDGRVSKELVAVD